jgi:hypothetical protein
MRWLITLLLLLMTFVGTGCVFSDDDGTPDAVVVDGADPPSTNTTIIEDSTPAPDVDVDVDATTP